MLVLSVSPNNNEYFNGSGSGFGSSVPRNGYIGWKTTRISFATSSQVETAAQQSVSKFYQKTQKKILHLADELESKQGFIESLNQKLNELWTISGKLKDAQDKIKNSLWDEIPTSFGEE